MHDTVEAVIRDIDQIAGQHVTSVDDNVTVSASDSAKIDAVAFGAELSIAGGTFASAAGGIGRTEADNTINSVVRAGVYRALVESVFGSVAVEATSTTRIAATSVAAALGISVSTISLAQADAGAHSSNHTTATVEAFIRDDSVVRATRGGVRVQARDSSGIDASVLELSGTGSLIAGAASGRSRSDNTVTNTVSAFAIGSTITATEAGVLIEADADQVVDASALAISIAGAILSGAVSGADVFSIVRGTTQAYARDVTLTAMGGRVMVKADSRLTTSATANGGNVGSILALSSMHAEARVEGTTAAYLAGTVTVVADRLDVLAGGLHSATTSSLNFSAGFVAHPDTDSIATVSRTTEAAVLAGTTVSTAGAVTVKADVVNTTDASAPGGATGVVTIESLTPRARVDGRITGAAALNVTALADNGATANVTVINLSVVGVSGAHAFALVNEAAVTEALVGATGLVTIPGAVVISAGPHAQGNVATAEAKMFSGTVVGISLLGTTATLAATTRARLDGRITQARSVTVQSEIVNVADASTLVVAAAAVHIDGGGGALAEIVAGATAEARVTAGASIEGTGDVTIRATSHNSATALAEPRSIAIVNIGVRNPGAVISGGTTAALDGPSIGVVNVPVANPTATDTSHTHAELLGNVRVAIGPTETAGARSVTVLAEGVDAATANLDNTSIGAINVDSLTTTANADPTVDTTIGAAGSVVIVTADIGAKSLGTTEADSSANSSNIGLVTVPFFASNASSNGTVRTTVATGARLDAGGLIEISATHNRAPSHGDNTFDGGPLNPATGGVDTSDDPGGNSITFAVPHGLSTGDAVAYDARGLTPIGGLTDGRQYGVVVPAGNTVTVQLGAAFTGLAVNPDTDTITFGTPHHLLTGDPVFYFASGAPVGGLIPGHRYQVTKIDDFTIKLFDPATPPTTVTAPGTSINGNTVNAANSFSNGDPVTYRSLGPLAGSFTSMLVDAQVDASLNPVLGPNGQIVTENNDTIYLIVDANHDRVLEDHGIQTGQPLVYRNDGTGPAIGGLVSGTTYFAIRVDARRIRLAATPGGPALALNPDKSATGRGVQHTLQRPINAPLPNLIDGGAYFVVNRTANSFQLASTAGGTPLSLNPGALTGGPHRFTRDGL